jgi:hypothetical protein
MVGLAFWRVFIYPFVVDNAFWRTVRIAALDKNLYESNMYNTSKATSVRQA